MRDDRPSDTAEGVCLFRAWEEARPVPRRVVDDPYARHFLSARGRAALALLHALGPGADLGDRLLAGLAAYALTRHACFDAWLARALEDDAVGQVVLLGAGYDSRAWRLAPLLAGRPLYEVDHPATGARKARQVQAHAPAWPAPLRHAVAVDLAHAPFAPALAAAGWRAERPTFWIWEGVSMYLAPEAVRQTLRAVSVASAPGSRLAVDFWGLPRGWHPRAALTRAAAATFALLGEPVRGSFPLDRGRELLAELGATVLDLADSTTLRARHAPDGRPVLPDCWCALVQPGALAP